MCYTLFMKKIGIVAEFNIFHNGHARLIDYARNELKADVVIIAMSGEFTQRGEIALLDKYARAKMAIEAGADYVFEIPTVFATASAKDYALGSVALLNAIGVDTLLFGSECGDINELEAVANALYQINNISNSSKNQPIDNANSTDINDFIKDYLKSGMTYPAALTKAISTNGLNSIDSVTIESILSQPNNTLSLEYLQAIRFLNADIKAVTIKRTGKGYNDSSVDDSFMSASGIREILSKNPTCVDFSSITVPGYVKEMLKDAFTNNELVFADDVSTLLHQALINYDKNSNIYDISEDLSNKIIKYKNEFISFNSFCDLLKTKDITHAKLSRSLCHILLNIDITAVNLAKEYNYLPYIRLLALNTNSPDMLHATKKASLAPIITSVSDADKILTNEQSSIFKIDKYAYNIRRIVLTDKGNISTPNEATLKFLRI